MSGSLATLHLGLGMLGGAWSMFSVLAMCVCVKAVQPKFHLARRAHPLKKKKNVFPFVLQELQTVCIIYQQRAVSCHIFFLSWKSFGMNGFPL